MNIKLSHNIEIADFTPSQRRKIVNQFTFANPAYAEALKFGRSVYAIDQEITLYDEANTGLLLPIGSLSWLINTFNPEVIDLRASVPVPTVFNGELRPYQERFIASALSHTHGVMVAETGAGKTISAIALAARLQQRALVLVKSKDLAEQWQRAIKQFTGLSAGLIGSGKNSEGEQFTIGLIQTLCKRDLTQLHYGVVICDECHNIPARQAYSVINGLNARYKFGLSATPQRRDNLEFMIQAAMGNVIAKIELNELDKKVLPVYVINHAVRFIGDPESWAEFLSILVNDEGRNRMIIESAITFSRQMGTIILCAQIGHCELLGVMARESGVNALVLHGQLAAKVRAERMAQAQESALIIGTLSLLSEGIDLPHLAALIFASPVSAEVNRSTPAATRLLQSIGRCRRPYPGKALAYVIDLVDDHAFGRFAHAKRLVIYQQQRFDMRES